MDFRKSILLQDRFHNVIPGGAHTYAKGDDQFPENFAPYIQRGEGCHVWDVDGNEFIEYGSGLRAIGLGHAFKPVIDAAFQQMRDGSNFIRPSALELEVAEKFLAFLDGADMVKFGKNGSDATSAAVRLSRAYTQRNLIAICRNHPFFSVDDWFIGTTPISSGIPQETRNLILKFEYNDIESVTNLFNEHPGNIACLMMEAEKEVPPRDGFLHKVQDLCKKNGTVFILDEMICGFRLHTGGGQRFHSVVPDLSAFGKALGNGFSISALAGKRDIMELGGIRDSRERVFLLSLTHGAETHCLAAALEVMRIYEREPVINTLWERGQQLAIGINKTIAELNLADFFQIIGRPCCMVYATRDEKREPSQPFRTLFLQETIKRGLLATSLVVNYSHSESDVERTIESVSEALFVYRRAIDEGIDKYLVGRPVKPVFRRHS